MTDQFSLKLHNSLVKKSEVFVPKNRDHIYFYACGPTVYDYAHIGNARSSVVFDLLFRVLKSQYPKVTYIRNITDIDDKIINKSLAQGISIDEITRYFTEAYLEDMLSLGVLPPTHQPHATDHIEDMIHMINRLIEFGNAYINENHVFFDVSSFSKYGQLSKRKLDDLIQRDTITSLSLKKSEYDFVLWKPSTSEIPGWDSPWGYGRPGWHIECSAMIHRHSQYSLDIHAGGSDLIFPHHENEIAQFCCAFPEESFANYWIHNGMLHLKNEKMSKSQGNIQSIRALLKRYSGEVIRYAFFKTHYRSTLEWSDALLEESFTSLSRLWRALKVPSSCAIENINYDYAAIDATFKQALNNDLNTPLAFKYLHEVASEIFKCQKNGKSGLIDKLKVKLYSSGCLIGFFQSLEEPERKREDALADEKIISMLENRKKAREIKDWKVSDAIRDELLASHVVIKDLPDNAYDWYRI